MPITPGPAKATPPEPSDEDGEGAPTVTELLHAWGAGDTGAGEALAPLVYAELRRQARRALRREGEGHTLQPTALVHEAWLRLGNQHDVRWESRTQFFAIAAQAMRRVLLDHARTRRARKRGGGAVQITLADADVGAPSAEGAALDAVDVIALDDALARLALMDPQKARLVDLRYFAGLSIPEAAEVLSVSPATVVREWAVARMWLRRALDA
jgi:RNA polymerase sigma factor (TIGR02999 family)